MPAIIAAIYLLLALRVRMTLEGALCGAAGNISFVAGAAGIYIRFDGIIRKTNEGIFLKLVPRYAGSTKKKKEGNGKPLRIIRRYLRLARTGRIEQLTIRLRVGLDDAGQTAVVAGALRALTSIVYLRAGCEAAMDLRVIHEFDCASFAAYGRCIFSCQAGDIMLAAIRSALKKRKKKEGKREWSGKASH